MSDGCRSGLSRSHSAAQLFRTFAEHRGSDLAGMSDSKLDETLRLLRYFTLAIRWCVLSVLDGRPLADVLHHQDDLLKYCVGNVVGGLSPDSKTILSMLRALDRPVSVQELAVVSDIDIDAFSEASKLLVQASLVVRSHIADDIDRERLALSSTARAYLPPAEESELLTRTLQRERLLLEDHERDQQKIAETGRYFDPNVVFQRTLHDGPVAHLLRKALREAKAGETDRRRHVRHPSPCARSDVLRGGSRRRVPRQHATRGSQGNHALSLGSRPFRHRRAALLGRLLLRCPSGPNSPTSQAPSSSPSKRTPTSIATTPACRSGTTTRGWVASRRVTR